MPKFNQKGIAHLFLILIVLIGIGLAIYLIQTKTNLFPTASEGTITINQVQNSNGYIIEFKDDPLAKVQLERKNNFLTTFLKPSDETIKQKHKEAKQDVIGRLKLNRSTIRNLGGANLELASTVAGSSGKILGDFSYGFNGIAVDITAREAEQLKTSPYVKNIYPNLTVKANLMDTVPMLKVDKIWEQKDYLNQNIKGKGINVGVIDTGADYTHPSLGATVIAEREFEQVSQYATGDPNVDQIFSIDGDRLVYASNNKISLYSFSTKQTIQINPMDNGFFVLKVFLKDNYLVYFGFSLTSNGFYLYDLNTKVHKKIASSHTGGALGLADGKIIFGSEGINGHPYGIYFYDIATETISYLGDERYHATLMFQQSDNKIAYAIPGSVCYDKIEIYDVNTKQVQDLTPTDAGPVLDYKDGKILYVGCSKLNFDSSWKTNYLLDVSTGETLKLEFPNNSNVQKTEVLSNESNYANTANWINKGLIGRDVIFFSKDASATRIIGYNLKSKNYVELNLLKTSGSVDGIDDKICFASNDGSIYCHQYDPNNPYLTPGTIFNSKVVGGYNFIDGTNNPYDDNGHGTHVASTIAGNGTLKGIAPEANIYAYKVLNSAGSGTFAGVMAAVDKAIESRSDNDPNNDIQILNLSLGADCTVSNNPYSAGCGPDDPQSRALDTASDIGITVVVAAGNSGPREGSIGTPGTARKAITVGAVDKSKQMADFSSRGPVNWDGEVINKPDVVAPGVSICAAQASSWLSFGHCLDNNYALMSGTSMATPHITGVVALLKQANPSIPPDQIKNSLVTTADSLGYAITVQGAGLVNPLAALQKIPRPSPSPSVSPPSSLSPSSSPSTSPSASPTDPPVVPPPPTTPPNPPVPTVCNPRPNIGRSSSMGPEGMTVSLSGATNSNTPSNPMTEIQFTNFSNGTVTIDGQLHTAPFTYAIPGGVNSASFLIKQVAYGQPTTISLKAQDSCGPYPLFFGGGTGANWPH